MPPCARGTMSFTIFVYCTLWTSSPCCAICHGPALYSLHIGAVISGLSVITALIAGNNIRMGMLTWLFVVLVGVSALTIGGVGVVTLLALGALPILLSKPKSYQSWVLPCWLGLWFVSTPLYHPYVRLLLPFTIAAYIAAGVGISWLVFKRKDNGTPVSGARRYPFA